MKHQNIINALSGSMWLSTEEQLETVRAVAQSILDGTNALVRADFLKEREAAGGTGGVQDELDEGGITRHGATAIVPLMGAIMPRANAFSAYSGGASAELFAKNVRTLTADDSVRTIVIRVDSGGGNVHGIAAAANAVREARKTKRVFAIADFDMMSAAYWIGSAAEKVFVSPTSNVGSIGVLAVLKFDTEEDQKRVEIIRSVPGKANVNPHEPLTDEARKSLQADIDQLHASFVEAISLNRNISMSKANELADGTVSMGKTAVEAGLADGTVESLDELLANIDAMDNLETRNAMLRDSFVHAQHEVDILSAEVVDYEERLDEAQATIAGLENVISGQEADTARADFEAVLDSGIDSGRLAAGLRAEMLADFDAGNINTATFARMVSNISAGTVVPSDEITPDIEKEAKDSLFPVNQTEIDMFNQFGLPIK